LYDVDVAYEGKIPNRQFGGKISRKSDIKHVMKILEVSKVYSRMEGNKIVILDK
jgi:transmembrane sensor